MIKSTKLTVGYENKIITGEEEYQIIGDLIHPGAVNILYQSLTGCLSQAQCLEKCKLIQWLLTDNLPCKICLGSTYVWSVDFKTNYGYEFNLPKEFHAWLIPDCNPDYIIDFALPGFIDKGMNLRDEIGPYIYGRKPSILVGKPPDWIQYTPNIKEA